MSPKFCPSCSTTRDASEFTKKSSSLDGLSRYCRSCQATRRASRPRPAKSRRAIPILHAAAAPVPTTDAATDYRATPEVLATWAAALLIARRGRPAPTLLFVGPSGSGKTEGAKHLANLSGMELVKVDAPAMTDPESWFGTREIVSRDGVPVTVVTDSAFVVALQRRCVLLIDEVNRVSDATRQIFLALLDDSRTVTNPLTGQPITRHPECYIIMTGNVGLAFTGTYAMDPAFLTRSLTTNFDYLGAAEENALAVSRHGVSSEVAGLFVRFANEARTRAKASDDFPPISTREVLAACELVSVGLDPNTAAHQVIINSASPEGGAQSVRAQLEYIWTGIRPK